MESLWLVLYFTFLMGAGAHIFMKATAITKRDVVQRANLEVNMDDSRSVRKRRDGKNTDVSGFSHEEKIEIVNQHNLIRTNTTPRASNMEKMVWNEFIAEMAQEWASSCKWGRGQPARTWKPWRALGQNLYVHSSSYSGKRATKSWGSEGRHYTYNAPSGKYHGLKSNCTTNKHCGPYTQVVWHSSSSVGCGVSYCSEFEGNLGRKGFYHVCYYGPAGNWRGSELYSSGEPCSNCPASRPKCTTGMYAGLCDTQSTCGDVRCFNGGVMNSDACICKCRSDTFTGQYCNVSTSVVNGDGSNSAGVLHLALPAVLLVFSVFACSYQLHV